MMELIKNKLSVVLVLIFAATFTMGAGWPPKETINSVTALKSNQNLSAPIDRTIRREEKYFVDVLEDIADQLRFIDKNDNNQWQVSQWTSWQDIATQVLILNESLADYETYMVESFAAEDLNGYESRAAVNQQAETLITDRYAEFKVLIKALKNAQAANNESELISALSNLSAFMDDQANSQSFIPIENANPGHRNTEQTVRSSFNELLDMQSWLTDRTPLSNVPTTFNPEPEDLGESIEVVVNQAIEDKALELENDPVAIYNWVKSKINYLPTFGSLQNSDQVLKNQQGNAFDTSALLIALLRAADIPARYRYGTIEVDADKLVDWMQVDGIDNAINILAQGGVPTTALVSAGQIQAVQVEHVWVEAWVDYFPSRGAVNRTGDSWVSLDASFKRHQFIPAIDLTAYGEFDTQQLITDLNDSATQGPFGSLTDLDVEVFRDELNIYLDQVLPALEAEHPGATVEEITNRYEIIPTTGKALPASLENKISLSAQAYSAIPESLMHHLNLKMYASARDISFESPRLTHNIPLPALGMDTLSINYQPATAADQQIIDEHLANNDQSLRPYLINVKPQIQINGVTQVEAGSKKMGEIEYWTAGITDPHNLNSTPGEPYQWASGSQVVLAVDAAGITPDALTAHNASQANFGQGHVRNALHQAGLNYFVGHDAFDELYASQVGGRAVRLPSVGAFYAPLTVRYMFGVPRTGYMSSYQTDVKRITTSVVAPTQELIQAYAIQSGSSGSVLEGIVWEMLFDKQVGSSTVSAISILHHANQKGVPIHTITQDNLNDVMPLLELSADAEQEIFNAVSAGFEVTTPQKEISLGTNYEGAGYIIRNPFTGAAIYRLEGGTNGAALVGCIVRTIILTKVFNVILDRIWKAITVGAVAVFGAAVIFAPAGVLLGTVAAFAANLYFLVAFGAAMLEFAVALSTMSVNEILEMYGFGTIVAAACSLITPCMANGGGFGGGGGGNCQNGLCGLSRSAGNPTDIITGAKYQYFTDYESSSDFGIEFTRLYYSITNFNTPTGIKWRHTYDRRITLGDSSNHAWPDAVLILREDGSWYQFDRQSDNAYSPRADISMNAKALGSVSSAPTGYEIINDADEIETYNAAGLLISIKNHSGMQLTLSYNSDDRLESVTDHFGHVLQFEYEAETGLLDKITDPENKVYDYSHDERGNLTQVTYPNNTSMVYHYEDRDLPHMLTGITNENGIRYATYKYNIDRKITDTYWIGGLNHHKFEYGNNSTTVTDPLGKSRTYNYQYIKEQNRITSVDESCGSCGGGGNSEQVWNSDGSLYQEIDFNGNITQHRYNDRGLETQLIEAKGTEHERITTTTWHPEYDTPLTITEPAASSGQMITTFTHFPNGEVKTKTITADGLSRTWAYTYNAIGQMLTEDGPRIDVNDITTWTYDTQGNKRTETNALGHLIQWDDYNAHGQAQSMTDANEVVTTYVYDDLTRLTTSTTESTTTAGEITTYEYTDSGQLEKLILPDTSFLLYGYDAADRLESISDNLGHEIKYTLDNAGNRTVEETFDINADPNATLVQKITNVYNELGRLEQSIGADNQITRWTYDEQGNEKTHTDPLLHQTASDYDELNRLEQITDPDLNTIGYSYDQQDNLTTVTDPRGLVTIYGYNGFNEQTKLTSPDTGITDYNYDQAGNLISKTDARSETAVYVYDALNRVDSITYIDEILDFTYDQGTFGKGRLSQVTDASGQTAYTYDDEGRVDIKTQTSQGINLINDYDYNALGQLEKLTTPSGAEITYSYRADGRVVSISVNGVEISRNTEYFPFGEPKSWEYGSGFTYQRNYDGDGRVDDYTQGTDVQDIGYDPASRIESLVDASTSWDFDYDNLDRLETADKVGTSLAWDYDATGNRLFEIENGTQVNYSTNPNSNRLDQLNSQIRLYDAAGNLTDDGAITSTYSGRNRLTSNQQGAQTTLYQYNAFGERVSKQSANLTLFAYDEEGHLLGEYDQAGNLISEVIWLDDTPIATIRPNTESHAGLNAGNVKVFFIHPDHLDTPRTIVDADNQVIWQWHSDPFGTALADANPDGDGYDFEFNLRFPGQYFDVETGTHYNYFRDYEPATGRYVQSDPIGLDSLEYLFQLIDIESNNKNQYINKLVSLGYYKQVNGRLANYSSYSYVGLTPLTYIDGNGLGKTKTWTNKKTGRKEVVIKCKNFKDAKDKAIANGGVFRKNGKLVVECHKCGGRHLHDKNHNNKKKPNLHYEF